MGPLMYGAVRAEILQDLNDAILEYPPHDEVLLRNFKSIRSMILKPGGLNH